MRVPTGQTRWKVRTPQYTAQKPRNHGSRSSGFLQSTARYQPWSAPDAKTSRRNSLQANGPKRKPFSNVSSREKLVKSFFLENNPTMKIKNQILKLSFSIAASSLCALFWETAFTGSAQASIDSSEARVSSVLPYGYEKTSPPRACGCGAAAGCGTCGGLWSYSGRSSDVAPPQQTDRRLLRVPAKPCNHR